VADTLVVAVDGTVVALDGMAAAIVDGMVVDGTAIADGMVVSGGVAGVGAALGSGFISRRCRFITPPFGGAAFRTTTQITPTINMTAQ
jgi:acyl dehydratase